MGYERLTIDWKYYLFMQNVEKRQNIVLWKSYGVNTARFLKYAWPYFKIMHERVNLSLIFLSKAKRNSQINPWEFLKSIWTPGNTSIACEQQQVARNS